MRNIINLYNVFVEVSVHDLDGLLAKIEKTHFDFVAINKGSTPGTCDVLGLDSMRFDFIDDDYIVFKKVDDYAKTLVTISKPNIAKAIGWMFE